jgi:hypothetical protein
MTKTLQDHLLTPFDLASAAGMPRASSADRPAIKAAPHQTAASVSMQEMLKLWADVLFDGPAVRRQRR